MPTCPLLSARCDPPLRSRHHDTQVHRDCGTGQCHFGGTHFHNTEKWCERRDHLQWNDWGSMHLPCAGCGSMTIVPQAAQLQYHKQCNSQPNMPLCCCHSNNKAKFVRAKDITLALHADVVMVKLQHNVTLNTDPREIDSRSLHSGSAIAPLCTKVDHDFIQL